MANKRFTGIEQNRTPPDLSPPPPGVKGVKAPVLSPTVKPWSNQGGGSKRMADSMFKDVKTYPAGNVPGAK